MRLLSILRKKFSLPKDNLDSRSKEMSVEEIFQMSISETAPSRSEAQISDNASDYVKDDYKLEYLQEPQRNIYQNSNNMLIVKSELLKEGKEIKESIQNGTKKTLLLDRIDTWAEYARLYIYKNQIIPTHYDEYMVFYKSKYNSTEWFIKKSLLIIETCK